MASWSEFEAVAPELAAAVQGRFDAHRHALMATLRHDGSPRISGMETKYSDGELWLAMMPDSRKAADLRRDPRFSLHSAPLDVELRDGDARIDGHAVEVHDDATIERFLGSLPESPPPSGVGLFRGDVRSVSIVRVEGNELVMTAWRPGEAVRTTRRQ